jgi:hypothetical protein
MSFPDLFVSNPAEVSSHKRLVFFVGSPPREMQILSGIAIPMWDSQLRLDVAEIKVHFEQDKPPGDYPRDWEYTAMVSLAGINSEGEDFTFTADQCELRVNEGNNELFLWAQIAVLGEPAVLRRLSYHVEVISKLPIQGSIFGTIRWSADLGDPKHGGPAPMFKVGPATYTAPPPLGGGGGGGPYGWNWDAGMTIETSVKPELTSGNEWAVPYSISGLPLDLPLNITPDLLPDALNGPDHAKYGINPAFAPPSRPITLTAAVPSLTGVDFEMTFPPVK